jgi:hypothetical protein
MSEPPAKDRRTAVVRLMALVCVAMALMCVALAWAWTEQREETACWRAAAEFQLQPEGDCRSSMWAKTDPGVEAAPARP